MDGEWKEGRTGQDFEIIESISWYQWNDSMLEWTSKERYWFETYHDTHSMTFKMLGKIWTLKEHIKQLKY